MLGKITLTILMAFPMISCANPKYLPLADQTAGNIQQKLEVCQAEFKSGHCVSFAMESMPDDDYATFLFNIYSPAAADGSRKLEDLAGGNMAVVLIMSEMGHGTKPSVIVERLGVGTYRAKRVNFSMPGKWDIHIQLKDGNDVKDEAVINILI